MGLDEGDYPYSYFTYTNEPTVRSADNTALGVQSVAPKADN